MYKTGAGGEYRGQWLNDAQSGLGIDQLPDGSKYTGEFLGGKK